MPQMIKDVQITGEVPAHYAKILTPEAVVFLEKLHKQFNEKRKSLLNEREKRQLKINQGELPDFLFRHFCHTERRRLEGSPCAIGFTRSKSRDYRSGRTKNDDQCLEFRSPCFHGGF